MNWHRRLIQAIVEQMERQRSTTSWKAPDRSTWVVDIDGCVVLTVRVRFGIVILKYELAPQVAQRNEPADASLKDNARALFVQAAGIVLMRHLNIRELPSS